MMCLLSPGLRGLYLSLGGKNFVYNFSLLLFRTDFCNVPTKTAASYDNGAFLCRIFHIHNIILQEVNVRLQTRSESLFDFFWEI